MENIYIISDVHGCYKTLLALIEQFPNKQNSKIVFVGDLVDKGNNSYDVIEFIKNNNYDCVLGNHEIYFIECQFSWLMKKDWGVRTLKDYETDEELQKHKDFLLASCKLFREYKDYKTEDNRHLVVSHCAIADYWKERCTGKELEIFLFNITYNKTDRFDNKDIFNVYGATLNEEVIISEYDAGLGCLNSRICALEFPSMKVYIQESLEENI